MSGKPAGMIALPSEMCLEEGADMQALIDWLFLDLATRSGDVGYIAERAVLAPLNVDSMVDKINDTDTVAASFYLVKCAALRPASAPPALARRAALWLTRPSTALHPDRYFTKDSVQLATSVSILLDARDHLDKYGSRTADAGTPARDARFFRSPGSVMTSEVNSWSSASSLALMVAELVLLFSVGGGLPASRGTGASCAIRRRRRRDLAWRLSSGSEAKSGAAITARHSISSASITRVRDVQSLIQ